VNVVLLPGDGIGPEVVGEAARVLAVLAPDVTLTEHAIGGAAIAAHGSPLPDATLAACRAADAVLMGAVGAGDYAWTDQNPEDGMFALRRELDVYANLRPTTGEGIDLLIVRELVGGLYFGQRGTRSDGTVFDTCEYHPDQVRRVIRKGFELARARGGRLTSVDKANVLATSRMWRAVAEEVAADFGDVTLDHLLVDTAAMRLVQDASQFDVIVTENTFGDILSDIAAALAGGLGEAASACLADDAPGLFEPVHGTAPDIAGQGVANPTATLHSTALLLEHGLGRPEAARRLMDALAAVAQRGGTPDQGGTWTTREVGDAIVAELSATPEEVTGVEA
jgi:3-isopropylmalate dehydrogenase